ncbi:hypothetical protein BJ508DRAFT_418014 [Ascobolus immersus RN42]|uniref:Uncharacterized protein n=1 Tax=Ascobolus immersus RN42 TaxID=1160509 RepID=A0A3N4HPN7_ASCIM|nr:hypothetical protein BJ508DRAFT_418014 [Ascobolus immersus RN42]
MLEEGVNILETSKAQFFSIPPPEPSPNISDPKISIPQLIRKSTDASVENTTKHMAPSSTPSSFLIQIITTHTSASSRGIDLLHSKGLNEHGPIPQPNPRPLPSSTASTSSSCLSSRDITRTRSLDEGVAKFHAETIAGDPPALSKLLSKGCHIRPYPTLTIHHWPIGTTS